MLVRQGSHRNEKIDRGLAASLAAIAGALNASAFYAVGFFSANMTGNVSTLSDHLAVGQWVSALFYGGIVLAFVLGAAVSTLIVNEGRRRGMHAIYAYSILVEAMLLAILGCADLWLLAAWRVPVLVPGLAFLMGLQNAVVTRISDARVRTTHVSGMATDLGIELGLAFDILCGREPATETRHNVTKLRLHLYTIGAFLIGGILGVFIYRAVGGYLLILAATLLTAIALDAIRRAKRTSPGRSSLPSEIGL
ncbi:YoaK family protein [Rhizobium ruizarguesonis]|uniref:YoaK family protein n=1 Tax=Rhizobium ruizarguesonis TaxID=2081791 RepID=UPI0037103320